MTYTPASSACQFSPAQTLGQACSSHVTELKALDCEAGVITTYAYSPASGWRAVPFCSSVRSSLTGRCIATGNIMQEVAGSRGKLA